MAVEAGKDVYSEKPMGNVLAEVKAARDTALKSKQIVQIGTQHRSEPYQIAAREFHQDRRARRRHQIRNRMELSTARAGAAAPK